MKSKIILTVSTLVLLVSTIWTAMALSATSPTEEKSQQPQNDDALARMDAKKAEILKRIGISAPLELPEADEPDFVAEAMAQGIIVEATLEEVEAAMKAAASTPSNEDDIAAMKLAHFGSYRFFMEERPSSEKTAAAR